MRLTRESVEKLQAAGRYDLIAIEYIFELGRAGVMPTGGGGIVDCKLYPEAIPIPHDEPEKEEPKEQEPLTCGICKRTGTDIFNSPIDKPTCEPCWNEFLEWSKNH